MQDEMAVPERSRILGAPVDVIDLGGVLRLVDGWRSWGGELPHHIVTVNPEFVIAARRDPEFAAVLNQSALATADGVGIVLAGRVLRVATGPRVTGVELVEGLAGLRVSGLRLFLLGAGPGVAEEAAERLRERFPGVEIVGTFSGSPKDDAFAEIEERLAASAATVLLVAFGHPTQDLWIARHRERLGSHGILVAAGIGGAFDYLSGRVPRAPGWLRRLGLEWLYRLVRQPWRWRRQLALPLFVVLVLRERLRQT
jgi:N-acetylglucosaminyldiphosphoundecaprenol N-acetyl-beta-D-mannosaminyltransferase